MRVGRVKWLTRCHVLGLLDGLNIIVVQYEDFSVQNIKRLNGVVVITSVLHLVRSTEGPKFNPWFSQSFLVPNLFCMLIIKYQ